MLRRSRAHGASPGRRIAIVIPVLNDWASLRKLIGALDVMPALSRHEIRVIVVDDGSFPSANLEALSGAVSGSGAIAGVRIVQLVCNVGHQRAIAVGLVEAAKLDAASDIVVMDSDGEDRPEDVAALIQARSEHEDAIVLAERTKRSEGRAFVIGYAAYKLLFRSLTGQRIRFGNFCLIPRAFIASLIHSPSTWNNLAAAIMRSRLPTVRVPTERGRRYEGRSKMNFPSLVLHGLGAISVYMDIVLVRMICLALAVGVVTTLSLAAVVILRVFTGLAIPGWASYVAVSLMVILFQAVMFASIALFQYLSLRSMPTLVPATYAPETISARTDLELLARDALTVA